MTPFEGPSSGGSPESFDLVIGPRTKRDVLGEAFGGSSRRLVWFWVFSVSVFMVVFMVVGFMVVFVFLWWFYGFMFFFNGVFLVFSVVALLFVLWCFFVFFL